MNWNKDTVLEKAKTILGRADIWVTFEYDSFWVFHEVDCENDQCYLVNIGTDTLELVEQG